MEAAAIPHWLQDQCRRLEAKDEYVSNLNLNIRRLDDSMMVVLSQALRKNSVISVLNMTSSLKNSPLGLNILAELILRSHASLATLHLSYNHLTDVVAVGNALVTNQKLISLHLDYNLIDKRSAAAMADALRVNTTLVRLHLNYNLLGDEGVLALADGLQHNTSLLHLGLKRNSISAVGASVLFQTIVTRNMSLQRLDLEDNFIPAEMISQIGILCRANKAGRRYLTDTNFPDNLWPALLEWVNDDPDVLYFFARAKPGLYER
ncbi:predicted protein [Phaeodactylum tricornutum CCAP 1055/1]|jgi:Ran GTPase-activating protein (RanGAP) involved in mRNA processing and transport|uniref:Uncharacterized protein n=2 Tax=Phaeodactylum tricornutum TaxID=2850 RepID=B7GE19_PHATC|nr:predicted protein [Phaeodactylum tricornutum CCAP 1055/1]XP_002185361.1 predicted protein [Phaeodactylum tricornutum CCAP 1055/1]EEC43227.1 predicted protein [Phaeodactylum tricornutum CCAP 1055/1]EEC43230.1 predicted protein [Phaeodactylum tricornutum CCAP 1055/1]|eukprot:XP_002185358.1 predicted protein [Phaeodactylum tricornutum CCAP 1055/1]